MFGFTPDWLGQEQLARGCDPRLMTPFAQLSHFRLAVTNLIDPAECDGQEVSRLSKCFL